MEVLELLVDTTPFLSLKKVLSSPKFLSFFFLPPLFSLVSPFLPSLKMREKIGWIRYILGNVYYIFLKWEGKKKERRKKEKKFHSWANTSYYIWMKWSAKSNKKYIAFCSKHETWLIHSNQCIKFVRMYICEEFG